jgi:plasmid stabilization system protein ParE
MRVCWTDTARDNLDDIYRYIARSSPQYALQTVDRLTRRSIQIAFMPMSGRIVPEFERPQLREIEGPYRIIYHLLPDRVDVLAVIHGARDVLTSQPEDEA